MTIAEFLDARYDEEEVAVHKWWTALDRDEQGVPAWIINAGGLVHPVRALADIAAKRAILKECVEAEAYYRAHADAPAGELTGLGTAVRVLAQPYAEHADFDPAWRVT